jgi:hypothetical protein
VWWYFVRGVTWLYRVSGHAAPLDGARDVLSYREPSACGRWTPRHHVAAAQGCKGTGSVLGSPGVYAMGGWAIQFYPCRPIAHAPWPPATHPSTPASTLCQMLGCFEKRAGPPCRFEVLPLIQAIEVPPQSQHVVDIASAHNHTPARTDSLPSQTRRCAPGRLYFGQELFCN